MFSDTLENISQDLAARLRKKVGEIVIDVGDIVGNIMLRDRSGFIRSLFDLLDDLDDASRVLGSGEAELIRKNLAAFRTQLAEIQEKVRAALNRMKALSCG